MDYQWKTHAISRPSCLYVFSDGVYDITQADGSIWGLDAFLTFSRQSFKVDQSNLDCLINHAQDIALQKAFEDDLTIMEIAFR